MKDRKKWAKRAERFGERFSDGAALSTQVVVAVSAEHGWREGYKAALRDMKKTRPPRKIT